MATQPDWRRGAPSGWLENVLADLLREPRQAVLERERTTFDELAAPFEKSLVLVGAGPLGKYTLSGLRAAGIEPLAFADNNPRLHGAEVHGLAVYSAADAVARFGGSACFVVTIYNGSAVRKQLRELNCPRVAPFAPLFWKYHEIFIPQSGLELPHRILEQVDRIRACYEILGDDISRRELCEQLRWRCLLDFDGISPPFDGRDTYFPPDLIVPRDDEVFVDCGAFDGDSVRSFLAHRNNRFGHIYVLEPDPANRWSLQRFVDALPSDQRERFDVLPYALSDHNGTISFTATSTAASKIAAQNGSITAECRRLDDILEAASPTYIKMDIEGAEPDALAGARAILAKHRPVVAACLYHRSQHFWEIPLQIKATSPAYEVNVRRYAEECWETVCYATSGQRMSLGRS